MKDGGQKSKSKDRGFLSIAVGYIAAQKNKRNPRCTEAQILGVRNILEREQLGAYHTLARELRLHDREYFFR